MHVGRSLRRRRMKERSRRRRRVRRELVGEPLEVPDAILLRIRLVSRSIFINRRAYRGEKEPLADLFEQTESLQLVLQRVFEFGEAQFGPAAAERFIQVGECVSS